MFVLNFNSRINEIEELLTNNRLWKQRLYKIGVVSWKQSFLWSFSGVLLRGSNVFWDVRKSQPYEIYSSINFKVPVGFKGDCFDRYLLRVRELRESTLIILQCLNQIPFGFLKNNFLARISPVKFNLKAYMESLIYHFKFYSQSFLVPKNLAYTAVEAPKGEFFLGFCFEECFNLIYAFIRAA